MRQVALFVVLAACGDPNGGTAVGNPGKLSMQVEGLPEGTDLRSGSFDVAALELASGRKVTIVRFDEVFDLLDPGDVEFPGGSWDTAVVLPRGDVPLRLEGDDAEGMPFDVALPVDPMVFEGDFVVDGDEVIVALSLQAVRAELDDSFPEPPAEPGAAENTPEGIAGTLGVGDSLVLGDGSRLAEAGAEADAQRGCATSPQRWGGLQLLMRR